MPIASAIGFPLAADVIADRAWPAEASVREAGYAVAAEAVQGASSYEPALLEAPPAVRPGDRLPLGCNAVVPADAVSRVGNQAEIRASAAPWQGVRRAGSDCTAGLRLGAQGETCRPELALLLEEMMRTHVPIRLVEIGIDPAFPAPFRAVLDHWAQRVGVRVTLGEDSHFRINSARPAAHRLALSPGDGANLSRDDDGIIQLGLPPEPDSLVAAWHALALPVIARLSDRVIAFETVPLAGKLVSALGLTELALLRLGEGLAYPLETGEASLGAILRADRLALLPPDLEGYASGSILPIMPLGGTIVSRITGRP